MPPAEKMGQILTNGVLGSRLSICRSGDENVLKIQRIPRLHIKTKAAAWITWEKINGYFSNLFILSFALVSFYASGAFLFIHETQASIQKVKEENEQLSRYVNQNERQDVQQTAQTRYDDYFLIVGESARRDYFHVYGYPVKNTSFLDSINGVIVNGMESAGTYTIGSW